MTANKSVRDIIERIIISLLLLATLLTQVKIPSLNYGFHNALFPLFSLIILALNVNAIKEVTGYHRRTLVFMALLYLWMWLSTFQSNYQYTAIKYSLKYSSYFLLFFTFLFISLRKDTVHKYYRILYYFLLFLGVFGVVEELIPQLRVFQIVRTGGTYIPRVASLMQNPNPFGSLMSFGLLLAILFQNNKIITKVEFVIGFFIFTVTTFLSGSRNAFFALLIGMFALLFYRYRAKNYKKDIMKIIIVCLVLFSVVFMLNNIADTNKMSDISLRLLSPEISQRIALWKIAVQEIINHPFMGIGNGVYVNHAGMKVMGDFGYNTHNAILNILVELGSIGLILCCAFIYSLLKKSDFKNPLIIIPVIMIFASSIFDFFIYETTFMMISLFYLAIAANSNNEHFQKPSLSV